jgi:hypothetical protein
MKLILVILLAGCTSTHESTALSCLGWCGYTTLKHETKKEISHETPVPHRPDPAVQ